MGFENEITKVAIKDVEETLQVMKDRVGPKLCLCGFSRGRRWKRMEKKLSYGKKVCIENH